MKNALTTPFIELYTPGVIAARCTVTGLTQLLSGFNLSLVLARVIETFEEGSFSSRELQQSFDNGTVELLFVAAYEDMPAMKLHKSTEPIVLRLKTKEVWDELNKEPGLYKLLPLSNTPKIKTKILLKRGHPPQVRLMSANGSKIYVQKHFLTMEQAESYLASTSMIQMVIDTNGSSKVFKPSPAVPDLASGQAVESSEATQTLLINS